MNPARGGMIIVRSMLRTEFLANPRVKKICTTTWVEQYVSDTAQIALSPISGANLKYELRFKNYASETPCSFVALLAMSFRQ
jgi:hypothetical protein